jgi:hypothetical protein
VPGGSRRSPGRSKARATKATPPPESLMVTYVYWASALIIVFALLWGIGVKLESWKVAVGSAVAALAIAWGAYYFHFQQIFVKRWGGVMTITVPEGQRHIGATWKDDNLWIENYDPATNTCHFSEYSKGNLLQGKVTIKSCNPL